MTSVQTFKRMFRGLSLSAEDIFLLEAFQIAYLPGWVPERALAVVLWANPCLKHFLVTKQPSVGQYITDVLERYGPEDNPQVLQTCKEELVWSIADLLVYNKAPEVYDALDFHKWDFNEITSITPLDGKVVFDCGAGTGRVALEAAGCARIVFAVEPVGRLRQFIREAADRRGLANLYVMDGFLHHIPLPNDSADVLITSHALGWRLEDELREFERLVRPGGFIIHCPGTAEVESEAEQHARLVASDWRYTFSRYKEADGWKRKYWKRL